MTDNPTPDLRALSDAATPGEWVAATAPADGSPETPADYVASLATGNGPVWVVWAKDGSTDVDYVVPAVTGDGPTSEANAAYVAALVNAHRAGEVPISRKVADVIAKLLVENVRLRAQVAAASGLVLVWQHLEDEARDEGSAGVVTYVGAARALRIALTGEDQ